MSFSIDWSLLRDGEQARQLQAFLNERFAAITLPDFLGPVSVKQLGLGTIPPSIALVNVTDPMEEFYLNLNEEDGEEEDMDGSLLTFDNNNNAYNNQQQQRQGQNQGLGQRDSIPYSDANRFSNNNYNGSANGNSSDGPLPYQRSEYDAQIEISISYQGDLTMSLSTELIVNQPTPNFMALPLTLTLTKCCFQATAVVAYIGNTINFCLKDPSPSSDGDGGTILKEFIIESAIGDGTKQVLKNVGKIEKFIIQQLNNFLQDYVVFPNFHSILLESEDS